MESEDDSYDEEYESEDERPKTPQPSAVVEQKATENTPLSIESAANSARKQQLAEEVAKLRRARMAKEQERLLKQQLLEQRRKELELQRMGKQAAILSTEDGSERIFVDQTQVKWGKGSLSSDLHNVILLEATKLEKKKMENRNVKELASSPVTAPNTHTSTGSTDSILSPRSPKGKMDVPEELMLAAEQNRQKQRKFIPLQPREELNSPGSPASPSSPKKTLSREKLDGRKRSSSAGKELIQVLSPRARKSSKSRDVSPSVQSSSSAGDINEDFKQKLVQSKLVWQKSEIPSELTGALVEETKKMEQKKRGDRKMIDINSPSTSSGTKISPSSSNIMEDPPSPHGENEVDADSDDESSVRFRSKIFIKQIPKTSNSNVMEGMDKTGAAQTSVSDSDPSIPQRSHSAPTTPRKVLEQKSKDEIESPPTTPLTTGSSTSLIAASSPSQTNLNDAMKRALIEGDPLWIQKQQRLKEAQEKLQLVMALKRASSESLVSSGEITPKTISTKGSSSGDIGSILSKDQPSGGERKEPALKGAGSKESVEINQDSRSAVAASPSKSPRGVKPSDRALLKKSPRTKARHDALKKPEGEDLSEEFDIPPPPPEDPPNEDELIKLELELGLIDKRSIATSPTTPKKQHPVGGGVHKGETKKQDGEAAASKKYEETENDLEKLLREEKALLDEEEELLRLEMELLHLEAREKELAETNAMVEPRRPQKPKKPAKIVETDTIRFVPTEDDGAENKATAAKTSAARTLVGANSSSQESATAKSNASQSPPNGNSNNSRPSTTNIKASGGESGSVAKPNSKDIGENSNGKDSATAAVGITTTKESATTKSSKEPAVSTNTKNNTTITKDSPAKANTQSDPNTTKGAIVPPVTKDSAVSTSNNKDTAITSPKGTGTATSTSPKAKDTSTTSSPTTKDSATTKSSKESAVATNTKNNTTITKDSPVKTNAQSDPSTTKGATVTHVTKDSAVSTSNNKESAVTAPKGTAVSTSPKGKDISENVTPKDSATTASSTKAGINISVKETAVGDATPSSPSAVNKPETKPVSQANDVKSTPGNPTNFQEKTAVVSTTDTQNETLTNRTETASPPPLPTSKKPDISSLNLPVLAKLSGSTTIASTKSDPETPINNIAVDSPSSPKNETINAEEPSKDDTADVSELERWEKAKNERRKSLSSGSSVSKPVATQSPKLPAKSPRSLLSKIDSKR